MPAPGRKAAAQRERRKREREEREGDQPESHAQVEVRRSRSVHVLPAHALARRLQIDQDELVRFIAVLDEQAVPELACHVVPHVDVHVHVPCPFVETTTGFWIPEF